MEEQIPSTSSSDERFQDIAQSLAEARARAREVLSAQRDDLDQLESGLSEHIRLIAQELAHDRSELDSQHSDLRDQAVLLKQQEEKLRAGQHGWEDLEKEVRHQQEEMAEFLQQKQDELDQREQQLREQDAQSLGVREEAKAAQEQARELEQALERSRQRLEQKEQSLDEKLDRADQQLSETKSQRRQIAGELKQKRSELARERKEVEKLHKSENESHVQQTVELARLREELQASRDQSDQFQKNLSTERESRHSGGDELEALRAEMKTLQTERDALHDQRDALGKQHEAFIVDFEGLRTEQDNLTKERNRLASEVEQLRNSEDDDHVKQAAEMSRLKEDLQSAGEACEQLQHELAAERESQQSQSDRHDALRAEKESLQSDKDALQGAKDAVQDEKNALQDEKNALQSEKNALQVERDGLREERAALSKQHEELSADLETLRVEQKASLEVQKRLTAELEQAQVELRSTEDGSVDAEELQQVRRKCELALEDIRQLKQENSELEEELATRPSGDGASEAELAAVRDDRETLIERLAEAELKASRPVEAGESQQKMQDLQRRFEMAVEDVRELKIANADLKEELAAAKDSQKVATPVTPPVGVNLDWEAQKNRLLASLEDDFDDEDEEDRQDRMTIEGTIHITDEIVADKEREIEELQRLLEEQSSKLGGVAVGAAAIAGMLDQDELICEERERLTLLQAQWKEKLSKAEIDMSVERAKMARERTELEARAESLENEIAKRAAEVIQSGGGAALSKSKGGNWLERLGLKDSAE